MTEVFCKDCKFFLKRMYSPPDCMKNLVRTDLVWGTNEYKTCNDSRLYDHLCGKDGKYFEVKTFRTKLIGGN